MGAKFDAKPYEAIGLSLLAPAVGAAIGDLLPALPSLFIVCMHSVGKLFGRTDLANPDKHAAALQDLKDHAAAFGHDLQPAVGDALIKANVQFLQDTSAAIVAAQTKAPS